jgi:hypothetical protein
MHLTKMSYWLTINILSNIVIMGANGAQGVSVEETLCVNENVYRVPMSTKAADKFSRATKVDETALRLSWHTEDAESLKRQICFHILN